MGIRIHPHHVAVCFFNAGLSWDIVVTPMEFFDGGGAAEVLVFLLYISFTYFAVLNVVTGM